MLRPGRTWCELAGISPRTNGPAVGNNGSCPCLKTPDVTAGRLPLRRLPCVRNLLAWVSQESNLACRRRRFYRPLAHLAHDTLVGSAAPRTAAVA